MKVVDQIIELELPCGDINSCIKRINLARLVRDSLLLSSLYTQGRVYKQLVPVLFRDSCYTNGRSKCVDKCMRTSRQIVRHLEVGRDTVQY